MSTEHLFDKQGHIKKPEQETAEPEKNQGPLTLSQIESGLDPGTMKQMQQTVGNTAVQRFLAQRQSSGPTDVQEDTAAAINSQRGQGHGLDSDMAQKAGQTMGQDFSDVTVHTDSQSDQLNRQLGAKAFTTGKDVFFREGAYNPASHDGQELIAHELTHVAQQGSSPTSVQGKMTVNDPNDQYEAEADHVADTVMNQPADTAVSRQEEEELVQGQEL